MTDPSNPLSQLTTLLTPQLLLLLTPLLILLLITLLLRHHNTSHPLPSTLISTNSSPTHSFSKHPQPQGITLLPAIGIDSDAHSGTTVQHLSRIPKDPSITPPPNLRQIHLLDHEILEKLGVGPGEIGENLTTRNVDLHALSRGTVLRFIEPRLRNDKGALAEAPSVLVQGLRNPCWQIDKFRKGLQEKFIRRNAEGEIVGRRAGVMGTVERGGRVVAGMVIVVEVPGEFQALECV